jgi:ComF family protein
MHWIQHFRPLLNLVVQSPCPLCQRPAPGILCVDCDRQLQGERLAQQVTAAVSLSPGPQPRRTPPPRPTLVKSARFAPASVPVLAWGGYGGTLRQAIATCKYHNHPELAQLLGQYLAQAWKASALARQHPQPLVIPVPLHPLKQQQRGFNQAELIAQSFCRQTGLRLRPHSIRRTHNTQPLFELSPQEREIHLQNAFSLDPKLQIRPPQSVLLVDDIYTTGATLRAIQGILRQHQIRLWGLAVVARTLSATPDPD